MRNSLFLLLASLTITTPASALSAPPGLHEKEFEVWDCHLGRTHPVKQPAKSNLAEIKQLAIDVAVKEGLDLSKYAPPSICFDANKSNPLWAINFEGIEPKPGNQFVVTINDRTRTSSHFWGM